MIAANESGLVAFATLLAIHRIAVDPAQLRYELGHHDPVTCEDLLRLAKRQDGVRARQLNADWSRLAKLPLPALMRGTAGWLLIGGVSGDGAVVQVPGQPPTKVARSELEKVWTCWWRCRPVRRPLVHSSNRPLSAINR
jgi:subfamily B ATP-binding cassette protein HlyB/CyaB